MTDFSRAQQRFRMSDTLFTAIRSTLDADPTRTYSNLVLYTSYGIVRGRVSRNLFDSLTANRNESVENLTRVKIDPDVLELDDAVVEHSSSHMPTAQYERLYVRLEEILSFAFEIHSNSQAG